MIERLIVEPFLAGAERIVAITFEVSIVADLLTDTMWTRSRVSNLPLNLHRPEEGKHIRALDVLPVELPRSILQGNPAHLSSSSMVFGTAQRDMLPRLIFSVFFSASYSSYPYAERTLSCLAMPFELLFDRGIDLRVLSSMAFVRCFWRAVPAKTVAVVAVAVRPAME